MKRYRWLFVIFFIAFGHASAVQAATIAIACAALGQELTLCREGAEAWARQTGHEVRIVSTPNSATDRLALYQQLLAAEASDIDVFQIDVIWPGILGGHFIDLKKYSDGAEKKHFPAIVENNTIDGRLVAMPWYVDAGVLYYRRDLLEKHDAPVPTTWQELTATAGRIQAAERAAGNDRLWGFVWQGRAYEGLTCNALEWIASHGGGRIIAADGKVTVANPQAAAALEQAAAWVGTISPPGVLNYAEEESRGVFQSGHAVFMRNWPYAWALAQSDDSAIKGKIGVTALPKGGADGRYASALGGGQLAVSRYSKQPAVAADLVLYLASPEEQKRRVIVGSYNPTIDGLYRDPDILAANPFLAMLYQTIVNAVPRPASVTGAQYNRVSNEFWNAVHDVLSDQVDAETSLARLARKLERILRRRR